MKYLPFSIFVFLASVSSAALAQTEGAPVESGSAFTPPPVTMEANPDTQPSNPAQMEVRLSAMEDQMRQLRGKNEENDFAIRKLTETVEKLQRDIDMRFSDLSSKNPQAGDDKKSQKLLSAEPRAEKSEEKSTDKTTAGDGTLHAPEKDGKNEFATPRDLYNYAFRLLNQTKYEESAKAFDDFTKKYPKDPLVGNAYYWMGETYYIRRDYVTAADNFRQGFEATPTGPKAADNLLKLAMSLDALDRNKEACVVLQQIGTKFKKGATSVVGKAEAEQKRIGCK